MTSEYTRADLSLDQVQALRTAAARLQRDFEGVFGGGGRLGRGGRVVGVEEPPASASPDLTARWYAFSEDRQRGRARAWLSDHGFTATPPTPRT